MTTSSCSHCSAPVGPGGAKGLDARCYVYQRRNGTLPPVERAGRRDMTAQLVVRMAPATKDALAQEAGAQMMTPSELARVIIARHLLAKK